MSLSSCATMKWKENYAQKNVQKIQERYIKGSEFQTGGLPSEVFKPTKELSRKEFKRKIRQVEKLFVIVPDSIVITSAGVDSIYINRYKIRYLKKNRLKTDGMIFKE